MGFLKRSDYEIAIKEKHLDQIITPELESIFFRAELAAIEEVSSYLRSVYDVDLILPDIQDWSENKAYEIDDIVWYEDYIYVRLTEFTPPSSSGTIPPDTDYINWLQDDVRNARILQIVIDVVLYHIHKRVSVHDIPIHRRIAYQDAIHQLEMIRNGGLTPNLPKIEEPLGHPKVISSRRAENWFWSGNNAPNC